MPWEALKMNARESDIFRDKKAVISGGSTGIGRAIALELARGGAEVLIFGRHNQELADASRDLKKTGARFYTVQADQASAAEVRKVFAKVDKVFGPFDYLINNAAIAPDELAKAKDTEIDYAVRANLTGYLCCAQQAMGRLKPGGHVINIGSMSAEKRGAQGEIYTATKAGIRGFSESLRKTLVAKRLRVTLVEPGWTGSDMIEASVPQQRKAQQKLEMMKAEDIADCVLFALTRPPRCVVSLMQVQPLKSE
jgi:NADP-dependent 3-hydroxy acid dehydrogenase YdfG